MFLFSLFLSLQALADFPQEPHVGQPELELGAEEPFTLGVEVQPLARNANAHYCLRSPDTVDTLVIHHTGSSPSTPPQQINDAQLVEGSRTDPWLMTGYHYFVTGSYVEAPGRGSATPPVRIYQGRPFHIVGSHAGTDIYAAASADTINRNVRNGSIRCGRGNEQTFTRPDDIVQNGKLKVNYSTVAVAVIGNYGRWHRRDNPLGYNARSPRHPTSAVINGLGQLACRLQKAYPRIRNIRWHSFYKQTYCPGTISCPEVAPPHRRDCAGGEENVIQAIIDQAERYGCTFN